MEAELRRGCWAKDNLCISLHPHLGHPEKSLRVCSTLKEEAGTFVQLCSLESTLVTSRVPCYKQSLTLASATFCLCPRAARSAVLALALAKNEPLLILNPVALQHSAMVNPRARQNMVSKLSIYMFWVKRVPATLNLRPPCHTPISS